MELRAFLVKYLQPIKLFSAQTPQQEDKNPCFQKYTGACVYLFVCVVVVLGDGSIIICVICYMLCIKGLLVRFIL